MDFNFVTSPSHSPEQSMFVGNQYFESTSEGSSPDSPRHMNQMMYGSTPMQYDMLQYGATPATFYPPSQPQPKIHVEYTGSSTLDDRDRRRRRDDTRFPDDKDKSTIPNMHLRRRAQNRASQRAFRERKERHVKGLEHQLENLHEKHQDLLQSYNRQADEMSKLNLRIQELTAELTAMRTCQDASFNEMLLTEKFDKFDAFSSLDMPGHGPEGYFDKRAPSLNSDFALHSFEESL